MIQFTRSTVLTHRHDSHLNCLEHVPSSVRKKQSKLSILHIGQTQKTSARESKRQLKDEWVGIRNTNNRNYRMSKTICI